MNGPWKAFYRHGLPIAAAALGVSLGLLATVIAVAVVVLW